MSKVNGLGWFSHCFAKSNSLIEEMGGSVKGKEKSIKEKIQARKPSSLKNGYFGRAWPRGMWMAH